MTKAEFLHKVQALYRVLNASDSDSTDRADWTVPAMASSASHLDRLLHDMLDAEIIDGEQHQIFYDTL